MTMHYPIPNTALRQHVAVLGKTRSGKSSVMRGLVEGLLDRREPVCIVDPKGDWWGIKLAADGTHPGYPVVIFGGEHADVPINANAGAHVAELFATGNRPCLIDLGGWMVGDRTRFWVDFASALFKHTRGLRWLVVDEVHNFCPKAGHLDPDAAKALHWTNRLASEGLGKGLAMLFASQRPQKVHNDTLTSAETLIAMRVLHPSDREAVSDWIKGCGDPKLGAEVLGSLAQLDRGEGWAWSPEIGFGPKRVKFPMFTTYDSFRPQTAADAKSLKGWADVNLEEVKAKLAIVVKEAEENDPRRLKAEIARLTRELATKAKAPTGASPEELKQAREEGRQDGYKIGLYEGQASARTALEQMRALSATASRAVEIVSGIAMAEKPALAPPRPATRAVAVTSPRPTVQPRSAPAPKSNGHGSEINGPQQRILDALAWWESVGETMPKVVQVAVVSRYSPDGGAFRNPLGALRSLGLVDYPQPSRVALTDQGRTYATAPAEAPTTDALHAKVLSILNGPQKRILEPLLQSYPHEMTVDDLAAAAGYEPNGGAFRNPLGSLRSLGLIEYPTPGRATALPILFLEG